MLPGRMEAAHSPRPAPDRPADYAVEAAIDRPAPNPKNSASEPLGAVCGFENARDRSPARSLKCKAPARASRRAQFQLWIFSYTTFVGSSKKCVSRVLIEPTTNSASGRSGRGRDIRVESQRRKTPARFPAGAIPTVDFLLHEIGGVVKKVPVKSHEWISLMVSHEFAKGRFGRLAPESGPLMHTLSFGGHDPKQTSARRLFS